MKQLRNLIIVFFAIILLFLAISCSSKDNKESEISAVSGEAAVEIRQGCEYLNGSVCSDSCCYSDEQCGEQKFSYKECNISLGEWKQTSYFDSNCLYSCSTNEDDEFAKQNDQSKSIASAGQKASSKKGACEEGWKCIENRYRGYQDSNCAWLSIELCTFRCDNGFCAGPLYCSPGSFRCFDNKVRKCNDDGDEWIDYQTCDENCKDGVCVNEIVGSNISYENNTNQNNLNNTSNNNPNNPQNNVNICNSACIGIANFHYDAAGNDCQNLNDEYVTFKNSCTFDCNLKDWSVVDATSRNPYSFKDFILASNGDVTLYTGCGVNTSIELHWCSRGNPCNAIWNNDHDSLYLRSNEGNLIINYTY